jgi:hypothetical protein
MKMKTVSDYDAKKSVNFKKLVLNLSSALTLLWSEKFLHSTRSGFVSSLYFFFHEHTWKSGTEIPRCAHSWKVEKDFFNYQANEKWLNIQTARHDQNDPFVRMREKELLRLGFFSLLFPFLLTSFLASRLHLKTSCDSSFSTFRNILQF